MTYQTTTLDRMKTLQRTVAHIGDMLETELTPERRADLENKMEIALDELEGYCLECEIPKSHDRTGWWCPSCKASEAEYRAEKDR